MSTYKLKYFDFKGRGEVIRLLFALKCQSYEDYRFSFDSWPKEKVDTPFGWVPTLTVGGKTYSDSMSIVRFLAREFGYAGKNSSEMLEVDQVLGIVYDAILPLGKHHFEKDATKKAELKREAYEDKLPGYFNAFEKILTSNGTGYYVGNKLTAADVAVFDLIDHGVDNSFIDKYPKVKANLNKVTSNDKIKTYLKSRKPSDF